MNLKSLTLCLALLTGSSFASAAVWQTSGSGNWSDAANWQGDTVPNAASAVADFTSSSLTASGTVTLGSTTTVGTLQTGSSAAKTWTFTGSSLALNNGSENAKITVASGATTKIDSALSSTGTVAISGGGTLQVSNASGVKSWTVTGATLDDVNASGSSLGTGTIYLNEGATLKSGSGVRRIYSNPIVFSGKTTLDSQGLTLNGPLSGSGTITFTGGWNMPIAQDNSKTLSADWYIVKDYLQPQKNGSLGTGKVTIAGGEAAGFVGGSTSLTEISNDIELKSTINFFVGNTSTITLTGTLTGNGNLNMRSNQYNIAGTTNFQGDGHAFTGTWTLNQVTSKPVYTLTTNNTNDAKQDGGDSRFGTGTIHFGRAIISPYTGTKAYIHNDFVFDQDTSATASAGEIATFSIPASTTLTLTGQLSGSYPYAITGKGPDKSTMTITGSNTTSGAISATDVKLQFSDPKAFGTSKLTLNNVTLLQTRKTSSPLTLANDIEVAGNVTIQMQGWSSGVNGGLTLSGKLTGSGNITRQAGGYELALDGDNSGFSGNWYLNTDVVKTTNTTYYEYNGTDKRFGSGIIFVNGGGISSNNKTYIDNNIIATNNFLLRGTEDVFRGIVSFNGTLAQNSTVPKLRFENQLMGKGNVNFATTLGSGAILSPGDILNEDGSITPGIGTIAFTDKGSLSVESGATLNLDVGGKDSMDKITFAKQTELNLAGSTIDLNFTDDFKSSGMDLEAVLNFTGTNTKLTGLETATLKYDVSQLPESSQWMRFVLTSTGIQVVNANYIPEPSAWLLLLIGVGIFYSEGRRLAVRGRLGR